MHHVLAITALRHWALCVLTGPHAGPYRDTKDLPLAANLDEVCDVVLMQTSYKPSSIIGGKGRASGPQRTGRFGHQGYALPARAPQITS